jgi:hypothetical protein
MIRLTVIGDQGRAAVVISAPYFRITGGSVWIGPSVSGERPLVRYVSGRWQFGDALWSGLRFDGQCRLVFGLARDPLGVSDELNGLSLYRDILAANGIPFAIYDDGREMWRGVAANTWWHAFRVESAGFRKRSAKPSAKPAAEGAGTALAPGGEDNGPTRLQ